MMKKWPRPGSRCAAGLQPIQKESDRMAQPYPFAALVGQDDMTLALQIVAVDQAVGGVLIMGDRGTGKSTAVRALADLLPPIKVVSGCAYGCDPNGQNAGQTCASCGLTVGKKTEIRPVPVVDLPLGATEDQIGRAHV